MVINLLLKWGLCASKINIMHLRFYSSTVNILRKNFGLEYENMCTKKIELRAHNPPIVIRLQGYISLRSWLAPPTLKLCVFNLKFYLESKRRNYVHQILNLNYYQAYSNRISLIMIKIVGANKMSPCNGAYCRSFKFLAIALNAELIWAF